MVDTAFERSREWDARAYWLRQAGPHEPSPPLQGDLVVDVAIVGGGFTGLWTALFLKEADPSLDVAVLEQEVAGYGASGRNGGFAMTVLDYSLHHLLKNYGVERARAAHEAVARSVREIGEFAANHGFDCEYELTGFLGVAASPGQVGRIRLDLEAAEKLALDDWTYLDRAALQEEVHSPVFECGAFERRGHDVPTRPPVAQVVDGGKLSRHSVRLGVGGGQRGGQANMGRDHGQRG